MIAGTSRDFGSILTMKRVWVINLLTASCFGSFIELTVEPVQGQIIELGNDIRVDVSNDRRRRTNVRVMEENGRLNVGVEEQRRPQTRVRLFGGNDSPAVDIRQERPQPEAFPLLILLGNEKIIWYNKKFSKEIKYPSKLD